LAGQSQPGKGWGKSSAEEQARRSVYIHVKRSLVTPVLQAFDFPDSDISCEARFNTTQPGQSLALLNGEFLNQQSQVFAQRVKKEAGDDRAKQVATAVRLGLSRPATADEVERGVKLMERLEKDFQFTANYCLLVYNLNEFLYLD
jgi:hypothetical protein